MYLRNDSQQPVSVLKAGNLLQLIREHVQHLCEDGRTSPIPAISNCWKVAKTSNISLLQVHRHEKMLKESLHFFACLPPLRVMGLPCHSGQRKERPRKLSSNKNRISNSQIDTFLPPLLILFCHTFRARARDTFLPPWCGRKVRPPRTPSHHHTAARRGPAARHTNNSFTFFLTKKTT